MPLSPIPDIIEDIKAGEFVIIVDDENRENEGDLAIAAEKISADAINFMATNARGLICLPIISRRLDELQIPPMVQENTSKCGVLVRAGHTEAIVDLARLAGLYPAGVICEILNQDGTIARLPQLELTAQKFGIKIVSIADLITYRRKNERLVQKVAEAKFPTVYGDFIIMAYKSTVDTDEHIALVRGDLTENKPVLVRVHSECVTGDVFGSLRCDCGEQVHKAMKMIDEEGRGVFLYMRQEGRGIGIHNKLKAYELQDQGLDTVEANLALGFEPDLRDYGIGAQILADLGLHEIRLLTNNPRKIIGLESYGLKVKESVRLLTEPTEYNKGYLKTKQDKMGHLLAIDE
ncbi:MAG: GTP cyclohydrolase II [Chloroflexi bacterium]|nr:GTP cyclohydrolase II [Chloroflexota bacterium]